MKEIQRGKCPEQSCFKHQHEREIERYPLLNLRRRGHRHGDDYRREQQHQQAQTVDAYVVLHAKRRNPAVHFLKLKAPGCGIESMPQDKSDRERKKSKGKSESACQFFALRAEGHDRDRSEQRHNRQAGNGRKHVHRVPLQISNITSTANAKPTSLR